ncbi:MAG: hypothetical protein GX167_09795 [Firmicutes bacterium]|nr:hypothetical protein [Bacillota bacterium]
MKKMTGGTKGKFTIPPDSIADVPIGQCDPVYGCPPPTEVVCVLVDKVYDECKNVQVDEVKFVYCADPENPVVDVICYKVELVDCPLCEVVSPGRVRVTVTYRVKVKLIFEDGSTQKLSEENTVVKIFNVARAGEPGLHLYCDVPFLECLQAFVKHEELEYETLRTVIVACIGKYTLIKLLATVQLAIPAYGFCPEPPDCDEVLGECPDFNPEWPPYPPQSR